MSTNTHREVCGNCHQPVCMCRSYTDAQVNGVCAALQDEIASLRQQLADATQRAEKAERALAEDESVALEELGVDVEAASERIGSHVDALLKLKKQVAFYKKTNEFLHLRRGQVCIERDAARARVAELEAGKEAMVAQLQAERRDVDQLRERADMEHRLHAHYRERTEAAEKRVASAESLYDTAMNELHRFAGIRRNGLAGLIGWIEETKGRIAQLEAQLSESWTEHAMQLQIKATERERNARIQIAAERDQLRAQLAVVREEVKLYDGTNKSAFEVMSIIRRVLSGAGSEGSK